MITGQSRQRRWTTEDKARIVAESLEGDANISEVVRRNGVARGLLTAWRRQFAAAARSKVRARDRGHRIGCGDRRCEPPLETEAYHEMAQLQAPDAQLEAVEAESALPLVKRAYSRTDVPSNGKRRRISFATAFVGSFS